MDKGAFLILVIGMIRIERQYMASKLKDLNFCDSRSAYFDCMYNKADTSHYWNCAKEIGLVKSRAGSICIKSDLNQWETLSTNVIYNTALH